MTPPHPSLAARRSQCSQMAGEPGFASLHGELVRCLLAPGLPSL